MSLWKQGKIHRLLAHMMHVFLRKVFLKGLTWSCSPRVHTFLRLEFYVRHRQQPICDRTRLESWLSYSLAVRFGAGRVTALSLAFGGVWGLTGSRQRMRCWGNGSSYLFRPVYKGPLFGCVRWANMKTCYRPKEGSCSEWLWVPKPFFICRQEAATPAWGAWWWPCW